MIEKFSHCKACEWLSERKKQVKIAAEIAGLLVVFAGSLYGLKIYSEWKSADKSVEKYVICIDPGHPTLFNSGKLLKHGVTELDMDWVVADRLKEILEKDPEIKAVKTREKKYEVMSNPDRAKFANKIDADLLVRLHCDAGPSHGFTVYYPNKQGTDGDLCGPSREVISKSNKAAEDLHEGMAEILDSDLRDRGVKPETFTKVGRKQGVLTGSIYCKVPVVTVEMVFLNRKNDAEYIKSEYGQRQMAQALAKGIKNYIERIPKSKKAKVN